MLRVVPDANRVAAALIRPSGWSAQQLHRSDVRFVAPEYLWQEIDAHLAMYAERAGCSAAEMAERVRRLREHVGEVGEEALLSAIDDALVQACLDVDPDDAPYMAAVVAADADFLWTNDDALWRAFRSIAVRIVPEAD